MDNVFALYSIFFCTLRDTGDVLREKNRDDNGLYPLVRVTEKRLLYVKVAGICYDQVVSRN